MLKPLLPTILLVILASALLGIGSQVRFDGGKKAQKIGENHFQSELEKARKELEQNPNSAFWHNQAAILYAETGDMSKAMFHNGIAIKLDPDNPINYSHRASFNRQRRDTAGELDALQRALALDPKNPALHFDLTQVHYEGGDLMRAQVQFKIGLENLRFVVPYPEGDVYYDSKGNAYAVHGKWRDAVRKLEQKLTAGKTPHN